MHPIASRFTPPARPTPYTLHAHHRRAFAGPNSWPRHHSSFPDSAHLPGTANAAPRLSRPPSHTFLAIVLALAPLLQTSEMHHDDREMSALGPGTDQLVTIPIPLRQRRSVGCFTYPPMWTRPADRAPSCGPCGQAMEKLTLPHRLPTLGALAPTSSPLLQQRFMEKATAPAPAGSRITPSSQEIRLRNTPTNSRGDPTRECEKQQHVAGTDRLRYFTARVSGKLDPGAPARHQICLKALATLPEVEIHYGRFLAKTAWRPLANLPVAGRRIDAPSPVTLPQGNHRVVGVRPQTLPVGHYPNRRGDADTRPASPGCRSAMPWSSSSIPWKRKDRT